MTTPQPSSGSAGGKQHAPPRGGSVHTFVTDWLVKRTGAVQTAAYLCAGGFVVALLADATTIAWLLLAAAMTVDTATYGLRAGRDRKHLNTLRTSGCLVHPHGPAAPLARSTGGHERVVELHPNRTHPLDERNDAPWRHRAQPHRR